MPRTRLLAADDAGLNEAAALLRAGRLVAFPTETVYGLGADAGNAAAVAGIFEAKGRPRFNPLIVHVDSLDMAARVGRIAGAARDLAQAFWPGPLTLAVPLAEGAPVADLALAGNPTVAIRMPAHPVARALIGRTGRPLAAPSANPSGRVSPTTAAHVLDGLSGRIAAVVDGGACPVGVESTILGFRDGAPVVLRLGGLPVEALTEALGRRPALALSADRPDAPGQLASHYAPAAPLRMDATDAAAHEVLIGFGPGAARRPELWLSETGDLREAAAALFATLRRADALAAERGAAGIAVAPVPDHGLGAAINDRLRRAAAPRPKG